MELHELAAFVEKTFVNNMHVVTCFHQIFRPYIAPMSEEEEGEGDGEEEDQDEDVQGLGAPRTKPQQEHAARFCSEIRRVYGINSPTYRGFIQTMNNYAQKDKDTLGTIRAIKELFVDNPTLVVEFANFVPATFKKYCTVDKIGGKRKAGNAGAAAGSGSLPALESPARRLGGLPPAALEQLERPVQPVRADLLVHGGVVSHVLQHGRPLAQQPPPRAHQHQMEQQQQQQQQQRDLYARYEQQLALTAGSDLKKRKTGDGESAGPTLLGGSHSLSAMCAQLQQQQQHQQRLLRQQQQLHEVQQQQQAPANAATMQWLHQLAQDPTIKGILAGSLPAASGGGATSHMQALASMLHAGPGGMLSGQQQGQAAAGQGQHMPAAALVKSLLQPAAATSQALALSAPLGHQVSSLPANTGSMVAAPSPSASVMTSAQSNGAPNSQAGLASPLGAAGAYAQSLCAASSGLPSASAPSLLGRLQAQARPPLASSPSAAGRPIVPTAAHKADGMLGSILQMDSDTRGDARQLSDSRVCQALPQLDGADADLGAALLPFGTSAEGPEQAGSPVTGSRRSEAADVSMQGDEAAARPGHDQQEPSHSGDQMSRGGSEAAAAAAEAAAARDSSKRVIKPREQRDFYNEPQMLHRKAEAKAVKGVGEGALKAAASQKQLAEEMKALIEHASQHPGTQQMVISCQTIGVPDLVLAIKKKGMENGNVVWVHVARELGINTGSCHNYSTKLLQLLEGTLPEHATRPSAGWPAGTRFAQSDIDDSRKKKTKSKGIAKRPSGAVLPVATKKPKAPVFINRMAHMRFLEADKGSIREAPEGSYVTLKLLTGANKSDRDNYDYFLPKKVNVMMPRPQGILAVKSGPRKAADLAQKLWVQTIYESVKRSDAQQERLKRQRMAKQVNVEGWDMSKLGRLVEAAAIGQGSLYVSQNKLCAHKMTQQKMSELGVLSEEMERQVRRSLSQVWRDKDPRSCSLCRIVGDQGVQGRLLYVEYSTWAHVNCLCWSKGVYERCVEKNIGKVGMLCNVHDVIGKSRQKLCDFCGCPGATVVCSAQGCCAVTHFGCAMLQEWSFYPEGRVFCECCKDSHEAEACGGVKDAWAPIHLYKLTSRHLRVQARSKPKLLENEPQKFRKGSATSKKRRAAANGVEAAHDKTLRDSDGKDVGARASAAGVGSDASQVRQEQGDAAGNPTWKSYVDKSNGRTYYHNHETGESTWTKPAELTTRTLAGVAHAPALSAHSARGQGGNFVSHATEALLGQRDAMGEAGRRAAVGGEDDMTERRLTAVQRLFKQCEESKCMAIQTAAVTEDNCLLGWASCVVTDDKVFSAQIDHVVKTDHEGLWGTGSQDATMHRQTSAESIISHVLSKIQVYPAPLGSKGWNYNKTADCADTCAGSRRQPLEAHASGKEKGTDLPPGPTDASDAPFNGLQARDTPADAGLKDPQPKPSKADKERARAAEAAAEAAERERAEALNREQWDAYDNNLLENVASQMQQGTIMARVGSLTVFRLGQIKTNDDNYHTELAIYPIGYLSSRICHAPGQIQSKAGQACRRSVYKCQILAGEHGGPPLFQVTVDNETFYGSTASQAWELATRRSLRFLLSFLFFRACTPGTCERRVVLAYSFLARCVLRVRAILADVIVKYWLQREKEAASACQRRRVQQRGRDVHGLLLRGGRGLHVRHHCASHRSSARSLEGCRPRPLLPHVLCWSRDAC